MRDLLAGLGLPAHRILEEALSDANKLRLRRQTETAAEKGIFGAPTFFAGSEMFWGNDRLDEAIACCKAMPSVP
jgi:2-hydroxychromene-2-carboxylate isomerase